MPQDLHAKIKKDIKKAHPGYSEGKLESATNGTMANIAKRSKRSGTFPGKGRVGRKSAPVRGKRTPVKRGKK